MKPHSTTYSRPGRKSMITRPSAFPPAVACRNAHSSVLLEERFHVSIVFVDSDQAIEGNAFLQKRHVDLMPVLAGVSKDECMEARRTLLGYFANA